MKKFLKIVGVLFLGAIGIGLIWYFQSLKVEGEPLLTACWGVEVYDDLTGEKVVGVEDLDFDPESGTIFMSAYDRRAVAQEIDEGKVTTQGGIYTLKVSNITDASSLKVTDISRDFKEAGNEFRPHGFTFTNLEGVNYIYVINRLYKSDDKGTSLYPVVEQFEFLLGALRYQETHEDTLVCDLYDVGLFNGYLIVTDFKYPCKDDVNRQEILEDDNFKAEEHMLSFNSIKSYALPNGIVMWGKDNLTYAYTLDNKIHVMYLPFKKGFGPFEIIDLPGAPDNLTVDVAQNLYVTIFPNKLDYYFYLKGWAGVRKHPSAVYRFGPNEDHLKELKAKGDTLKTISGNEIHPRSLLFKNNGDMISGATVALRAGDYLILGSGWDDHIAICSGMDGLD